MATLEVWHVLAIAILASAALLLTMVIVAVACFFLKRRRMLCWKSRRKSSKTHTEPPTEEMYGLYTASNPKKRKSRLKKRNFTAEKREFSDPFINRFSNPFEYEDYNIQDWENPLFDMDEARERDAIIRIQSWWRMVCCRIPFLELKEAVTVCQAAYRGYRVRKMLPQYRREKQEREARRKKELGYKKKGTLSALKFYDVKGYGFAEVEQLYGLDTMRFAAEQLKNLYGGRGKMKLKLFVSVKGVNLYDHSTFHHFAVVKMRTISFCSLDPKNKKLFAFINRKKNRNFCHVFQCHESSAQKLVETMAEAFEVTFKHLEIERKQKENERLEQMKKQSFKRSTQELDKEVDNMMKFAESASIKSAPSPQTLQRLPVHMDFHHDRRNDKVPRGGSLPRLNEPSLSFVGAKERLIVKKERRRSAGNKTDFTLSSPNKTPEHKSSSSLPLSSDLKTTASYLYPHDLLLDQDAMEGLCRANSIS